MLLTCTVVFVGINYIYQRNDEQFNLAFLFIKCSLAFLCSVYGISDPMTVHVPSWPKLDKLHGVEIL